MIINKEEVLGLILAGGLSRRMNKENKFLKNIGNKTILNEIVLKSLNQVNQLVINANIEKKEIKEFNIPVIKDTIKGNLGPLAGILSGMEYAEKKKFKWLFTFPCDAPFFPENLVEKLLIQVSKQGSEIVIPKSNGRLHPVFGIWSVSLKKSLENSIKKEKIRKIDLWIQKHNFSYVNFQSTNFDPFFNINDLNDLEKAKKIFKNAKITQ